MSFVFPNNKANKYNLGVLHDTQLINKFRFTHTVDVNDGVYYFDDNWSYIEIYNKRIIKRVYFTEIDDEIPSVIFLNIYSDKHIEYYSVFPKISNELKLEGTVPNNEQLLHKIEQFSDILEYSNYVISTPYTFEAFTIPLENVGGGTVVVRLTQGQIIHMKDYIKTSRE